MHREDPRRPGPGIRKTACVATLVALSGCASIPAEFEPGEAPDVAVTLTRIAAGVPPTGTAVGRVGFASAVAARAGFIYAVDSSIPAVVELDPSSSTPHLVTRLRDGNTAGLYVTHDQLIYVVDPATRSVRELDASGTERRRFTDGRLIPTPVDVTLTNWGAIVLVADELTQRVAKFDTIAAPAGLLTRTLSPVSVAASIRTIAATEHFVFVLDAASREVTQLDLDGRMLATYGEDALLVPVAMTVDECRRIFVADGHADGLFISSPDHLGRGRRAALPAEIRSSVTDLWIDGNELYVAAGPFGIHAFTVDPPCLGR